MSRKLIFYIAFFVFLVVGFYFTMTMVIPGYGDRKYQVLNHVKPFSFTNQMGERFTQEDVDGKVYVAEYFFTTCESICPIMNANMQDIYEIYKDDPNFMILSHTVDPIKDSVGRLRKYADSLNATNGRWMFLTGSKDSLYNTARMSYLLDDPKNNSVDIEEQFLHTQFFALVDKNGQLRKKIYDGLKKEELEELKKDIQVLLDEPRNEVRFVNNLFGN